MRLLQLIGDLPFRVWVNFREKPAGAFEDEFARLVVRLNWTYKAGRHWQDLRT